MSTKIGVFAVVSLSLVMLTPSYADVTSFSLHEKSFFTIDETFSFSGKQEGKDIVYVIIRDSSGNFKGMLSDPAPGQGEFSVIPRLVENFFASQGTYNATAFTDKQKEGDGVTIELEFDGDKVFQAPDVILKLKTIDNKEVEVEKTITFTVKLVDDSIKDPVFSLKNEPSGATIDSKTGKFVWTPSKSHGSIQDVHYGFDIIVKKGSQEDTEEVIITVKKAYVEPEETEPKDTEPKDTEPEELGIASFVDESKDPQSYVDRYNNEASYKKWFDDNFPEYASIYEAVGIEEPLVIPAPFVDESKDPQSYVDRYNNEASYKKWFDDNFPEYASIYEAVGIEEPLVIPAPFVDESKDPQSYVDRYNNEASYKKWFDDNFPEYASIYEAVGIEEPEIKEDEYGICGPETKLIDGICTVIPSESKGGGCLIATAAYGSEMAPQVQFLREIRDNQLMITESGMSFMTGFNQLYYSFSPYIADMQRENLIFKEVVKIGITPLLASLSIMEHAESESQVLGYGIGVILMNIGMYFAAPILLLFRVKKYIKI